MNGGGIPPMFMNQQNMPQKSEVNGIQVVILAGGKGKRMNSGPIPKVLCKVRGKEMLCHIVEQVSRIQCSDIFIVVNQESAGFIQHIMEKNKYIFLNKIKYILQRDVNGTGGALQCVLPHLDKNQSTLILNGDMPNVKAELLNEFLRKNIEEKSEMGIVTSIMEDAENYGRIIRENERSKEKAFKKIVEKKDCKNEEELNVKEINAGIYYFSNIVLHTYLPQLNNENVSGEYYLTSIFDEIRKKEDNEVLLYVIPENMKYQILGVNTQEELLIAEKH